MVPVAGVPLPFALTVAVNSNDCVVCCEDNTVVVLSGLIVKVMGVKLSLELKLLSP
jgi:hypothetical protein